MIGFNREDQLKALDKISKWDIIVIGGGSTGLGIAVDAASRGYKILLLEQSDFSKGTSSRSTKLVHGGVRYLEQGNIALVYSALKERGLLLKNSPHLVHKQPFIIPCYSLWDKVKYMTGLKMYDWLSGRLSFGKSVWVSKKEINECLGSLKVKKLRGGIKYFDGQFDDSRLAIALAKTAVEHGGITLNYFKVTGLIKDAKGKIEGVQAEDIEKNKKYEFYSKLVINATGVFTDDILNMDEKDASPILTTSQGIHIVVSNKFLNGPDALMIPETKDGRVLFAVPWHQHILIGTTDTPVEKTSLEPQALNSEVDFILETLKAYLQTPPAATDILSIFAGLRPLVISHKKNKSTKELSRDHKIYIHPSGLYTITGGKWTTYRKMAEDVLNSSIKNEVLPPKKCITMNLPIHGSDIDEIKELTNQNPQLNKILVAGFNFTDAEVVWSIRYEMARTIEDILARRLRILFLNARLAMEAAPRIGEILKQELKKDDHWLQLQLKEFNELAKNYLYKSS